MDETKARILEAATSLLKTMGIEGLTVEAAADLAGVSRKTVYNHFANRYALVDEAATAWVDKTLSSLKTIADDPSLNVAAKLNAVVERGFAEMRAGGRLMRRPHIQTGAGNLLTARQELAARLRAFIVAIVEEAQSAGYVRQGFDTGRLSWVIINMVEGLMLSEEPDDLPFSKIDVLKDSLRAILGGVLSPKGAADLRDSLIFS